MPALPLPFDLVYWGIFISDALLGFTLLQGWIYFQHNEDRLYLRLFVALLIVFDIATAVLATEIGHSLWIAHFGEDISQLPLNWASPAEAACSVLITALVQLFFVSRVYLLYPGNWIAPSVLVLLTAVSFVFGLRYAIHSGQYPYIRDFADHAVKVDVAVNLVLDLTDNFLTSFLLLWKFQKSRSTTSTLTHVLQHLITTVVTRGLLVTVVALVTVITYLYKPEELYWTPMHFSRSRVYVITMLAMLNGRKVRQMMDLENSSGEVSFTDPGSSGSSALPRFAKAEIDTTISVESRNG